MITHRAASVIRTLINAALPCILKRDEWWGLPILFPGGVGWPSFSLVKFSSRWYNHSVIIHTLYTNVMLSRGCYFLVLDLFLCFNYIFLSALQYSCCNIVTVEVCTQLLKSSLCSCLKNITETRTWSLTRN